MESLVLLFIFTAMLMIQIRQFNRLCKHLAAKFPEEWEKLSRNPMGLANSSVCNANFAESLKSGFFSTVQDPKLQNFLKLKRLNICVGGILVLVHLAMAAFT